MVIIRSQQMKVLEEAVWRNFEQEMVEHARAFSPRLSEVIGDDQLRTAVRSGIARARTHELTRRGPIRLYIELMLLFGSGFDTDPQYERIADALGASESEMARAERIHRRHAEYLKEVSGPGAANVRRALKGLLAMAETPVRHSPDELVPGLLAETTRVFPEKVAWAGEEQIETLIREGITEAGRHGFSTARQQALIVVLMFAFGHGCTSDPLYPWIGRTLGDERIPDAAARAERLERKAVTWLKHVLAESRKGSRT